MKAKVQDPKIQAAMDAMVALLDEYQTANSFASHDGSGPTVGVNCTDYQGFRFSYSEYSPGVRVSVVGVVPPISCVA